MTIFNIKIETVVSLVLGLLVFCLYSLFQATKGYQASMI